MKRFVVIGMGHFGRIVTRELYNEGEEVIAIDIKDSAIHNASDFSSQAIVADATDKSTLESIGFDDVDGVIVSLGSRMDSITLVALHMKEMNVPYVCAKAVSIDHAKILKAIGVDEIVHPERESATRLASRLSLNNVIDYIPMMSGYSVVSLRGADKLIGMTIEELQKEKVLVIAVQDSKLSKPILIPKADMQIVKGSVLVIVGANDSVSKFAGRYCK